MDTQLFPGTDVETVVGHADSPPGDLSGPPRLRRPDRAQWLMRPQCLEELVPPDHPVRMVWALVERLDLSGFHEAIRARGEDCLAAVGGGEREAESQDRGGEDEGGAGFDHGFGGP